jgi:signal transduction histidine kinase
LDIKKFYEQLTDSIANLQQELNWTGRIIQPNGSYKWFQIKTNIIREEDGLIRFPGYVFDVTDEQELILRNYIFSMGDDLGVWEWNLETGHVNYDQSWCAMLGEKKSSLLPNVEEWENRLHPDEKEKVIQEIHDFIDSSSSQKELRYQMKHRNGSWIPILSKNYIFERDEKNKTVIFYGIHQDFRFYQDIENKMIDQERFIQDKNKMVQIGELASGVAHEINNPLTIILGYHVLLEKMIQSGNEHFSLEKAKDIFKKQKDAAERIQKIVNSLRFLVRVESGAQDAFNISETIVHTIGFLEEIFYQDQISVIYDNPQDEWWGIGSKDKLQQVIINLLNNAKDALNEVKIHKKNKEIHLSLENKSDQNQLILSVRDNGIGMSEEIKKKIFHTFFTTKDVGKGTGLGLSLCLSYMKQMGGDLYFESKENEGTTFYIVIKKMEKTQESKTEENVKDEKYINKKDEKNFSYQKDKILILGDDWNVKERTIFKDDLVEIGHQCQSLGIGFEIKWINTSSNLSDIMPDRENKKNQWSIFLIPDSFFISNNEFIYSFMESFNLKKNKIFIITKEEKNIFQFSLDEKYRKMLAGILKLPVDKRTLMTALF